MHSILTTGIGGVVGQGILKNLSKLPYPVYRIGTDIHDLPVGIFLCDQFYQVPYAYDPHYIERMNEICRKEKVSLIIPATDWEAFVLKQHEADFPCPVAGSPADIAYFCLDKYETYRAFRAYDIPFAETCLPSDFHSQFQSYVVKPRKGRGSRQIYYNPIEVKSFDDEFCVQEYLEGEEITTACYVTKEGRLLGQITFIRELDKGNTVMAQVTQKYESDLEKWLLQVLQYYSFRGPFNIQSKVTERGIIPFEINCRISGTNSFRSFFGFCDVEYCVKEYLTGEVLSEPQIRMGSAMRFFSDVVYPDTLLADIKPGKSYIIL